MHDHHNRWTDWLTKRLADSWYRNELHRSRRLVVLSKGGLLSRLVELVSTPVDAAFPTAVTVAVVDRRVLPVCLVARLDGWLVSCLFGCWFPASFRTTPSFLAVVMHLRPTRNPCCAAVLCALPPFSSACSKDEWKTWRPWCRWRSRCLLTVVPATVMRLRTQSQSQSQSQQSQSQPHATELAQEAISHELD